jgi:EpsI family protein
MNWFRYAAVAAMLAGTASMLFLRSSVDRVPAGVPLELLPHDVMERHAIDIPIDPHALELLGKGIFLNRLYVGNEATPELQRAVPVSLFIGYFPTQRTGQAIHSPQNCLPGAGWTFESERTIDIPGADGKQYQVGDYVITDGQQRQEVLYWYRAHGRSIASDFRAKLYMLLDAIRYNRTDGALIRVITPVVPGEPADAARQRAISFASDIAVMLPAYVPD